MRRRVLAGALVVAVGLGVVVRWRQPDPLPYADIQDCVRPAVAALPPSSAFTVEGIDLEQVSDLGGGTSLAPWVDGRRVLVALRVGELWLLDPATGDDELVADLTDRTALLAEGGLIGLAVAPDGDHVYLHLTDPEGTSRILEMAVRDGALDIESERLVLSQPHPAQLHNGGSIAFGPDGYLYVGFGDGGGRPSDAERVKSLDHWDGKILRIDPRGDGHGDYSVPDDNPYVGEDAASPELWLIGMRNPYRFAFDPVGGDLWVGDVGEACYEELTLIEGGERGLDLGFPAFEGVHEFLGGDVDVATFPSHTYDHDEGCAVITGVVSRDPGVPDLDGALLFSDFCAGGVQALRTTEDGVEVAEVDDSIDGVFGFGTGPAGEAYVLSASGVHRIGRT